MLYKISTESVVRSAGATEEERAAASLPPAYGGKRGQPVSFAIIRLPFGPNFYYCVML